MIDVSRRQCGSDSLREHGICRRPIVFPETSRAVPVIESIRPVP